MNVIRQTILALKSQRFSLPLLAAVLILQIICGQTAAAVLSERQPVFRLAVQATSADAMSMAFVQKLGESTMFTMETLDPSLAPSEVFDQVDVQGLVVIPANFQERLGKTGISLVNWYTAPGINDSSVAREHVADCILQLRAELHLKQALEQLGETHEQLSSEVEVNEMIEAIYLGPELLASGSGASTAKIRQVYAISALLAMLAFLHAAFLLPQKNMRRLLAHGRSAWFQSWVARLLAVWIVWAVIIALYFLVLAILGTALELEIVLGFILIILYLTLLGGLVTVLFGQAVASWLFVPLFLLNMTLGGGIWGESIALPALSPLLPVTIVLEAGSSFVLSAILLLSASVFCMVAILVVSLRLTQRQNNILNKNWR